MSSIRQTELTHCLVQSFTAARAALEDVFQHYKMGRYGEAFPEKSYFLLSRCTHVLFSLWLAEQENERGFFGGAAPPAAFALGLDFGELRYSEYKRRLLHGDELEEHLRNETKWFEFWMRLLEPFDPASAPACRRFCQALLTWVREPGFLEGKVARTHGKALRAFLMGDETGRVLTGTLRLLEDLLRTIIGRFTAPENRTCVAEQMILLTGLLREMRRLLIWETPAKGPYALGGRTRWRNPSPLRRLLGGQTRGFLTVVPKREGGAIVCTFQPAPGSAGRRAAWGRPVTSLPGTYEAELFATWSYRSGAPAEYPDRFPDLYACWTVQNTEAGRLEALSKQIDSLLEVLQQDPVCLPLAVAVRRVARNDASEWQAAPLPWTYISQLDQLIDKLTFVYREAKAVGGDDAALRVIERLWPSGKPGAARGTSGDNRSRRETTCPPASACAAATESAPSCPAPVIPGTLASLLQRLGAGHTRHKMDKVGEQPRKAISPERKAGAPDPERAKRGNFEQADATCAGLPNGAIAPGASEPGEAERPPTPQPAAAQAPQVADRPEPTCLPPSGPAARGDSEADLGLGASQATTAPAPPDSAAAGSPDSTGTDANGSAIPVPRIRRPRRPTPPTRTTNTDRLAEARRALVRRLLEHHEQPDGTINRDPLSSADLQRDLGWSLSNVQRALTDLFGPKPVTTYRAKCREGTIGVFLKAQAGPETAPRVPVRAEPPEAGKAPGPCDRKKPRRQGRRVSV